MEPISNADVYQTLSPKDHLDNLKSGFKFMPLHPPQKKQDLYRNIQPSFFERINPGVKNRTKALN